MPSAFEWASGDGARAAVADVAREAEGGRGGNGRRRRRAVEGAGAAHASARSQGTQQARFRESVRWRERSSTGSSNEHLLVCDPDRVCPARSTRPRTSLGGRALSRALRRSVARCRRAFAVSMRTERRDVRPTCHPAHISYRNIRSGTVTTISVLNDLHTCGQNVCKTEMYSAGRWTFHITTVLSCTSYTPTHKTCS